MIEADAQAAIAITQQPIRNPRRGSGRTGAIRDILADLAELPPYEVAPQLYSDWGEGGEFKVRVGQGDCAV